MPTSSRRDVLLASSTEQIERLYRRGQITALQKNTWLREKAGYELETAIADKGYLGAIWSQSIKNLQQGLDNLKEAATRTPTTGLGGADLNVKNEAYYVGLAVWGQIQMLTSAMSAVGEVTGNVAEQQALRLGAAPGLSRAIGLAVDIGSGFAMPTGFASRS